MGSGAPPARLVYASTLTSDTRSAYSREAAIEEIEGARAGVYRSCLSR